jgi:ankyrin repeat domain-containing protein 50
LKKCKKKSALLNALKSLPKTLDDTYARILKNIDENDRQEARRALLWLAFSQRPLSTAEVAEAAVVDPQSNPPFDTEDRLVDPCNSILEILGSLVVVSSKHVLGASPDDDSKRDSDLQYYFDDASGNLLSEEVRLAHFSVKEYLVSERIKGSEASKFGVTNVFANHFIAESCLLYIFHYDEFESKTVSLEDLERFPLLQYSCKWWYSHANSIAEGTIDSVIFKLFLSDTALSSWLQVYRPDNRHRKPFTGSSTIGTPLYYASDMGLQTVVQLLLDHNAEVDAKDEDGQTALHKAALNGHETVVRLLLDHNAEVDVKDEGGRTALHGAAFNGHEVVVRLLLDHQAEVDAKSENGRTTLHRAAFNGYETMVRLLLDHQAEVNAKSEDGWTALHRAALGGHEAVVRLLLDHQAKAHAKDEDGRTALHEAALGGHEAVVRLLLDHQAEVHAKDKYGWTALHRAASNGHEAVVRLLLDHQARVDVKDKDGWTALHRAASNGHEVVVQLLLSHQDGIDAKDEDGLTAGSATARVSSMISKIRPPTTTMLNVFIF